jgi:hypothetical protein
MQTQTRPLTERVTPPTAAPLTGRGGPGRAALHHIPVLLALAVFLALGAYQLQLPGLHYDEAKEAGLNAMQIVTGQPLTAFRDAAVRIGPIELPLMVQDYIGALNPLLAVPFLAVAGLSPADPNRGVIALRWLPLLTGALTLYLTWRLTYRLCAGQPGEEGRARLGAAVAAALLAVNPAFVFWSRQGVFVTNLTTLFFVGSLLAGLNWQRGGRRRGLWLMALCWGLGIYAKLLFAWAIGAMVIVGGGAWLWTHRRAWATRRAQQALFASLTPVTYLIAALCFLVPLVPLIVFNLRTDGTLISIFGNLGHSYYGVNNRAYLPNLLSRLGELAALLRGDFFWYLGEAYANPWAVWVAGALPLMALAAGAWRFATRRVGSQSIAVVAWPLALLALIVAQSAFTVSDLFITHYALLLPLIPLAAGASVAMLAAPLWPVASGGRGTAQGAPDAARRRIPHALAYSGAALALLAATLWWGGDLWTTVRYHRVLAISGGYGAHSDAIGELAGYLAPGGPAAPLALDWGMDAPLRYLTVGRVNPIEVFGYAGLDQPDAGFAARISPFLDNPANVYLAHAPSAVVFHGRVEALQALAASRGLSLVEEKTFRERSGRPLFIVYRAVRLPAN